MSYLIWDEIIPKHYLLQITLLTISLSIILIKLLKLDINKVWHFVNRHSWPTMPWPGLSHSKKSGLTQHNSFWLLVTSTLYLTWLSHCIPGPPEQSSDGKKIINPGCNGNPGHGEVGQMLHNSIEIQIQIHGYQCSISLIFRWEALQVYPTIFCEFLLIWQTSFH